MNPCYKIVLTGGPCAGKTTSISVITERLEHLGWRVFRVPETATLFFGGGCSFLGLDQEQIFTFQVNLLRAMLAVEDSFTQIAESCGQKSVVLCDRGAMDTSAYMSRELWERVLREEAHDDVFLKHGR